ncbi:MAG TPA: transglycosylase SLT domain-containing protein [Vicinamibacterales bacterium]|nr:transglycosylase SLT domain-containing protein [Vicinamibacterales bacterium]
MRTKNGLGLTLIAVLLAPGVAPRAQQPPPAAAAVVLKPTSHPRLPSELSQLWLAPVSRGVRTGALSDFAIGVKLEVDSNFAKALPIFMQPPVRQGPLGHYAEYYQGLAELRLGRASDARHTFQELEAKEPVGYLLEAAALREAECDEALNDQNAAMQVYERLSKTRSTAPDEVLMRFGRAARAAGHLDKATEAYSRVVYEFPFSDLAPIAGGELESLPLAPIAPGSNRFKLELGRAERLFGAKRYAQARPVFDGLRAMARDDDREVVQLRLAECDYFLKRTRNARDGVRPFISTGARQGEALYFYAVATRELGGYDEYLRTVRRIVAEFPNQSWAEEALNNLATQYILQSDDDNAENTFREMYEKFPTGHYAERAAWKIGWWAYRSANYAETVRVFEGAAANFPRSDYRPPWLYWSGRAHEALREQALADSRYALVEADYRNTYYGRLAAKRLDVASAPLTPAEPPESNSEFGIQNSEFPALPPNEAIVRALLGLDLYDQALDELHYAQKVWGDSSAIQATIGWIFHQRGELRTGINLMKRAYPQYMAAGGEKLPPELLKVLFPLDYWPLIKHFSAEHQLDPYLIAALILQESNFTADIRSPANAYGLMQIVPATGRQYAKALHMPGFSLRMLTTAEPNLKMGTAYFADLVRQYGGEHYALATYNAGPSRIVRWKAAKPGLEAEEFIDDIPFPETQNYVKRILGTAEDYRRLYGPGSPVATDALVAVSHPAAAPSADATAASAAKKKPVPAKKKKAAARKKKAA